MALKASKSWNKMYEAWKDEGNRERYSPEERAALVRGCMGKPAIENLLDAFRMVKSLPPREDSNIHIYCCELCGFLHFGNLRPDWKPGEWRTKSKKARLGEASR